MCVSSSTRSYSSTTTTTVVLLVVCVTVCTRFGSAHTHTRKVPVFLVSYPATKGLYSGILALSSTKVLLVLLVVLVNFSYYRDKYYRVVLLLQLAT